jgi:hypothetical protein
MLVVFDALALHQVEPRAEPFGLKRALLDQCPHMATCNAKLRGSIRDTHPIFQPHPTMVPHLQLGRAVIA